MQHLKWHACSTFINSANEAHNLVLILHVFRFVHIVSNATANSFMVCFVSMYVHIILKLSTHVKNGAIVFMQHTQHDLPPLVLRFNANS